MHLSAVHQGSVAALLGGVVYAVLPVDTLDEQAAEQRVSTVLREFLERTGGSDLVGIGRVARDLHDMPRPRQDADRVLRASCGVDGTFRYRLHRIVEIGDVDLSDSESRLALMLQLRLLGSWILLLPVAPGCPAASSARRAR